MTMDYPNSHVRVDTRDDAYRDIAPSGSKRRQAWNEKCNNYTITRLGMV